MSRSRAVASKYAQETTVHGISDLYGSPNKFYRVFWVVVIVACFAAAIYEGYKVYKDYMDSPVIMTYNMVTTKGQKFPVVQICMGNIINKTRVKELKLAPVIINYAKQALPDSSDGYGFEYAAELLDLWRANPALMPLALQPTRAKALQALDALSGKKIGGSTLTGIDKIIEFAFVEIEIAEAFDKNNSLAHQLINAVSEEEVSMEQIQPILAMYQQGDGVDYFAMHYPNVKRYVIDNDGMLDIEKLFDSVGYDLEEVLTYCVFMTHNPDCKFVAEPVFDQRYGRCFLVDFQKEQIFPGVGIQIEVNTFQELAWPEVVSAQQGINVRVDRQFNPTSTKTFKIPTGTWASIQLHTTHYLLGKSEKYGKCHRDIPRNISTFQPYSDTICRAECMMSAMLEQCKCTMIIPKRFKKPGSTYKSCAEIGDPYSCLHNFKYDNLACVDQCKPACEHWDYAPVVTYNKYPSPVYKQLLDAAEDIPGGAGNYYERNSVRLEIAFSDLNYMKVEQKDAMSIDGFISQMGGQVGLFVGASFLSVAQLIAAIFSCCVFTNKKGAVARENCEAAMPYYLPRAHSISVPIRVGSRLEPIALY